MDLEILISAVYWERRSEVPVACRLHPIRGTRVPVCSFVND